MVLRCHSEEPIWFTEARSLELFDVYSEWLANDYGDKMVFQKHFTRYPDYVQILNPISLSAPLCLISRLHVHNIDGFCQVLRHVHVRV